MQRLSKAEYLERHGFATFLTDLTEALIAEQPADPKAFVLSFTQKSIEDDKKHGGKEGEATATAECIAAKKGEEKEEKATPQQRVPGAHRYWRIVCTESSSSGWEAYFRRVDLLPSLDDVSNPARGGVAFGGNPSAKPQTAFDDIVGDHINHAYRTQGNPGSCNDWLLYDSQKEEGIVVKRVRVWQYGGASNHVGGFQVQLSDDLENWWVLFQTTGVDVKNPWDSLTSDVACSAAPSAPVLPKIPDEIVAKILKSSPRRKNPPPDPDATGCTQVLKYPDEFEPLILDDSCAKMSDNGVIVLYNPTVALCVSYTNDMKDFVDSKLVKQDEEEAELRPAALRVLDMLAKLLYVYKTVIGKTPSLEGRSWHGRVRVEVGYLQRGAGGLASHGVAGIAVGPAFLKETVELNLEEDEAEGLKTTSRTLHQVFYYEMMRNFIFPEDFTTTFEYHLAGPNDQNYGWINQSFVNLTGNLLSTSEAMMVGPKQQQQGWYYHGMDAEMFREDQLKNLRIYEKGLAEGIYSWELVFYKGGCETGHQKKDSPQLLPWNEYTSLDNLWGGILITLATGDWPKSPKGQTDTFLKRWWAAIPHLKKTKGFSDRNQATDNFLLAASFCAGKDLTEMFVSRWQWPVADEEALAAEMRRVLSKC